MSKRFVMREVCTLELPAQSLAQRCVGGWANYLTESGAFSAKIRVPFEDDDEEEGLLDRLEAERGECNLVVRGESQCAEILGFECDSVDFRHCVLRRPSAKKENYNLYVISGTARAVRSGPNRCHDLGGAATRTCVYSSQAGIRRKNPAAASAPPRPTGPTSPVQVSLIEAIRTGEFGPIRIGMTQAEVAGALGDPDDRCFMSGFAFWKYGDFEFYFEKRAPSSDWILWLIHVDHFETLDGGPRVDLDQNELLGGLGLDRVLELLQAAGVQCAEVTPIPSSYTRITCHMNVEVWVVTKEERWGWPVGLSAVSWFDPRIVGGRPLNFRSHTD